MSQAIPYACVSSYELLKKYSFSDVSIIYFTDEKTFEEATPNSQNEQLLRICYSREQALQNFPNFLQFLQASPTCSNGALPWTPLGDFHRPLDSYLLGELRQGP